jgi:CPA1 family monovalent cation:H+ antiporter
VSETLLLLAVALIIALLLRPVSDCLRLPFSLLLVVAGAIAGWLVEWLMVDIGLRWQHFRELVFTIFLPILVFESALHIRFSALKKVLLITGVLALPMMVVATLATAFLLYFAVDHPQGFPWIAALLCGAILSATDPVAVVEVMRKVGAPEQLTIMLDGESLLNDAVAVVLFTTFVTVALSMDQQLDVWQISQSFLWVLLGGLLLGLLVAVLVSWLIKFIDDDSAVTVFTLACVYSCYLIAEHWLAVSGVTALLVLGISLAGNSTSSIKQVWGHHAFIANALVFMLMGITVQWSMFSERYLAIILGIAAVFAVRAMIVFGTVPLLSRLPASPAVSWQEQQVLVWGGLRGVVAAALALSLPIELDYWFTIQAIVYGVVIFSLLVQAPTISPLLKRL